jgi:hypothetical protein
MNSISQVYRKACREIDLPAAEKALFMKLLREISVNALRSRKDWNKKEEFMSLFFMSAGRFPELAVSPYGKIIGHWIGDKLAFELSAKEKQDLWI